MIPLELPLSEAETSRLYWELSRLGARSWGEKTDWPFGELSPEQLLALALRQSRYDPRLLAILIALWRESPPRLDPLAFKEVLSNAGALPLAAVTGEWLKNLGAPAPVLELFAYLVQGVHPMPTQLFYLHLYPLGGKAAEGLLRRPLWEFKKWGFLAADPPLLKESAVPDRLYLFDQPTRLNLLKDLVRRQRRFTLADYLKEVRHSISRQQALKDLSKAPWLKKTGTHRGRWYAAPPHTNRHITALAGPLTG